MKYNYTLILVKNLAGKTSIYNILLSDSIYSIKSKIEKKERIPIKE